MPKTITWPAAPLGRTPSSFPCRPPPIFMQHLETGYYRVLLKRPENYDLHFRELIDQLFAQVADSLGEFGDDRIVRLEAGLFISSGATTTPFHFGPEIGFFSQIEGEKIYHVYPPSILGEEELEYLRKRPCVDRADRSRRARSSARACLHAWARQRPASAPKRRPLGRDARRVLFPIRSFSKRKRGAPRDVPGVQSFFALPQAQSCASRCKSRFRRDQIRSDARRASGPQEARRLHP